jgi:hypothetical protein
MRFLQSFSEHRHYESVHGQMTVEILERNVPNEIEAAPSNCKVVSKMAD